MSNYRSLLDLTSEILIERTKCYRALVIAFVVISLLSIVISIVTMNLWPMTGFLLLIPAYSLFLLCDGIKLNQWRTQVLISWKSKAIDINALKQALTTNKVLPPQTLDGMLETLFDAGDLVTEQSVPVCVREALADALTARDNNLFIALLGKAMLQTIAVLIILSAIILNACLLLMLLVVPIVVIVSNGYNRRILSKVVIQGKKNREASDFDIAQYQNIAKTVSWHGVSPKDKDKILMLTI